MFEGYIYIWGVISTISCFVGIVWAIREHYINQPVRCSSSVILTGKTAIITGADSGVGKELARALAERGCRVILACESLKKGIKVAENISKKTGNSQIRAKYLDTGEFTSVRNFADEIIKTENGLHILVNCATINGQRERINTSEGFEKTIATNYLGHFLLTNLLLGLLKSCAPSRIITLSSEAHRFCKTIDPDDLNYERTPYKGQFNAYGNSKMCLNLFILELAKRLNGTGVTANCVQPNALGSEIFSKGHKKNIHNVISTFYKTIFKPEKLESQVLDFVSVSEEVENKTGCYFINYKVFAPSKFSRNEEDLGRRMWVATEKLLNM